MIHYDESKATAQDANSEGLLDSVFMFQYSQLMLRWHTLCAVI